MRDGRRNVTRKRRRPKAPSAFTKRLMRERALGFTEGRIAGDTNGFIRGVNQGRADQSKDFSQARIAANTAYLNVMGQMAECFTKIAMSVNGMDRTSR